MRQKLAWSLGLLLLAGTANAQLSEWTARTGDRSLDRTLQSISAEAKSDPSNFWSMLGKLHGIPEPEIQSAREATGLGPADMYMASAIASITRQPIARVAEECSRNRDKGWGALAKEMGIKPGSTEFHRLKSDARGSLSKMKAAKKERQKHEKQMKQEQENKAKGKGGGKSY